jgi:para-nitrobenzyl esterase
MIFRDNGPGEDCLYLSIWVPEAALAGKAPEKVGLSVMSWIYGGGFAGGSSSEPRQDGSKLATKGVVVVSSDYRLGIFG